MGHNIIRTNILLLLTGAVNFMKIHWPVSMKKESIGFKPENLSQPNILATWKAMEALYDLGKARAIGVSNFSCKKLGDLLEVARIPPAVNQVECHPTWQQSKLQAFCNSKGVHLSVSILILIVLILLTRLLFVPKSEMIVFLSFCVLV